MGAVGAALEMADLRVSTDQATAVDIVADNAGAGLVVLGPERSPRESPGPWRARVLLRRRAVGPCRRGHAGTTRSAGSSSSPPSSRSTDSHSEPARSCCSTRFGTAVPLTGDGRYAAEVDGRVVASIRFGASRPARPEGMAEEMS